MQGAMNIVYGDTNSKYALIKEDGLPKDLTGYTITLRVATDPVTSIACSIADAGLAKIAFDTSTVAVGIYKANFVFTHASLGTEHSEQFTVDCQAGI